MIRNALTTTARLLLLGALVIAAAGPAGASDKFIIEKDKPLDDSLRPGPGKALIYFVRSQTMGFAVKVKLYAGERFLGLIQSKTYIPYECEPGKHEFIAAAENAGFLEAEVQAGRIYYVQVAIHMGAMKARTHFEVARAGSEAMDEIQKVRDDLRAVTTTEEGRKWVEEEDADIKKTIRKYREKGEEFENLKPEDGFEAPPWKR